MVFINLPSMKTSIALNIVYRLTASVAQLDRVLASEAKCRVFESPRAHHTFVYKSKA